MTPMVPSVVMLPTIESVCNGFPVGSAVVALTLIAYIVPACAAKLPSPIANAIVAHNLTILSFSFLISATTSVLLMVHFRGFPRPSAETIDGRASQNS